jgi:hypothetical protein
MIFVSIMGVGVVVWLWSLAKALQLGSTKVQAERFSFDETPDTDVEAGEVTIHGDPVRASKALVRSLRQPPVGMFGALFRVIEQSPDRLVVEKAGALICNQPTGLYFSEAEFRFEPLRDNTTRVSYRLGYKRIVRLFRRIALGIILGIGLPVMLIVGTMIGFFVVRSVDPAVRWQVFQTLQITHALWPPFLFLGIYSRGRRESRAFVENLIASVDDVD